MGREQECIEQGIIVLSMHKKSMIDPDNKRIWYEVEVFQSFHNVIFVTYVEDLATQGPSSNSILLDFLILLIARTNILSSIFFVCQEC